MKKLIALFFLTGFTQANAQQKQLSEAQLLRGARTAVTTPLPQVLGWVDDNQLLINKKVHPDSAAKVYLVDGKTGKMTPASADLLKRESQPTTSVTLRGNDIYVTIPGQDAKRLTQTEETETNPTLSPDQ
ncbi:MAG: hypothetical protein RLZZ557_1854, partial [Bacteroidota bacterium]